MMTRVFLFLCFSIICFSASAQNSLAEDVVFNGGSDSVMIAGTVTRPIDNEKHPAIILVSGTGQQDRDGTMGELKMFAILAEQLTKRGMVVLRTDDRGVGKSTGDYDEASTYDFAMDANCAVEFLKKYPFVDSARIGLLGHSEGGAAISIAASINPDVKFLISLSGLAMNGLDALLTQNESLVKNAKIKERDRVRYNEVNALMFANAYQYADSANIEQRLNEVYANWRHRDSAYFALQNESFDTFRFPIHRYAPQAASRWYRFFVRYNAELYLSKIKVPVLAINGNQDSFVTPQNLVLWKKYAGAGKNDDVSTHLLNGLGHLLQDKVDDKAIAPVVLDIIYTWLEDRGYASHQ